MNKEFDFDVLKQEINREIEVRGLEGIYYVLFNEKKRLPWAFHLFYRDGKFMVNARDERSYVIGKTAEFHRFEDAKEDFIATLEKYVAVNIQGKALGIQPDYPSPLWDQTKEK